MQWVKVQSNTPSETFELWNDDKKVAGASFSNTNHIVRMVSVVGKRLFFYGNKGWLVQKPVIKNEYGITLGMMESSTESGEKGYVELDGKKYTYQLEDDDSISLQLVGDTLNQPITSCSFANVFSKGFSKTKSLMNTRFPQLLLLLCWYSFNMHHHSLNQQHTSLTY